MTKTKPLHRQIADQIRDRISQGEFAGSELPTELSMVDDFGVSRHTIRAALQHLVNEGLIERRAGSGTWVTDRARSGIWAIGTLNDLIGEFTPDQYLTLQTREEQASRFPELMERFDLHPDDAVFNMLRLLLKDNQPYALAQLYVRGEHARTIPSDMYGVEPLIHLVERYSKVRAARARQAVSAGAADVATSRQLGMQQGTPILIMRRTYFDASSRMLLHTDVFCRPDRYEQVIDFIHEPAAGPNG